MSHYYNENDKKAAAWLRALIKQGSIPEGDVDERDIQNVRAAELVSYNQCHFFAGIVGWPLALKLAGVHEDENIWTGSCPCQPFSVAGKGLREADERHLWPYFRNLIAECRPARVFGEQVASAAGREWIAGVSLDLEKAGYRFAAADLPAAGVGSPQKRQRLFWVADSQLRRSKQLDSGERVISVSDSNGSTGGLAYAGHDAGCAQLGDELCERDLRTGKPSEGDSESLGDTGHAGREGRLSGRSSQERENIERYTGRSSATNFWSDYRVVEVRDGKRRRIPVEPSFFPLVTGFPARVAILRGFGNAICPIIAAEFIKAAIESCHRPASIS